MEIQTQSSKNCSSPQSFEKLKEFMISQGDKNQHQPHDFEVATEPTSFWQRENREKKKRKRDH